MYKKRYGQSNWKNGSHCPKNFKCFNKNQKSWRRLWWSLGSDRLVNNIIIIINDFDGSFIFVTIPFDKSGFKYNDTQNDTQKDIEQLIIELILINSHITKDEMATKVGVSKATIARTIRDSKRIKHIGSSKNGYWEVAD